MFGVAWTTADRWAGRYRAEGKAGLADRSIRPHASPSKTGPATTERIVRLRLRLRLRERWGAVRLAAATGVAPSSAGAVLGRCRIGRLSRLEWRERPVIRYGHPAPGELRCADVKELGNIPVGGGWRFLGASR